MAKHSGAAECTVWIRCADGGLEVVVEDAGSGFDPETPRRGLRGLEDRVRALDGRLELSTAPGRGTRLRAWLPG